MKTKRPAVARGQMTMRSCASAVANGVNQYVCEREVLENVTNETFYWGKDMSGKLRGVGAFAWRRRKFMRAFADE